MHQGQCSLPADEAGRILDRLAGLEQVFRPEDIQQALAASVPTANSFEGLNQGR
jgi:hypothetical protein